MRRIYDRWDGDVTSTRGVRFDTDLHVERRLQRQNFETWLIAQAVSWHLRYPLKCRDLESIFIERAPSRVDIRSSPERSQGAHACGHDGHTAMLLGAARELTANPDFAGRLVFLFQPAEEHGQGARAMIANRVLERFGIDEIYGIHNWPRLAVGHFATRVGPLMASEDNAEIRIKGKGAHAASPQRSKDPIVTGSHIVLALQTIVSRRMDPLEQAVVSVTEFITDGQVNVLPEHVVLRGDTRSYLPSVQKLIEHEMRAQATGPGTALGSEVDVDYRHVFASTVNHEAETGHACTAAHRALGADAVTPNFPPVMGSEDFGLFLEHRPGNFSYLGNGTDGPHCNEPLHNAAYDFNDTGITPGVAY